MAWIALCISTNFGISNKCPRNVLLFFHTNYFTLRYILLGEKIQICFLFMNGNELFSCNSYCNLILISVNRTKQNRDENLK